LYAVAPAHFGCAAFAASTASRRSLRLACDACATMRPFASFTGTVRPLSLRGNAPFM